MATPTPDLAGFEDAQNRLHAAFAEPVTFLFEKSHVTWPSGTAIDPDTDQPYDPAVRPTASAQASAAVPCQITFRAVRRGDVTGGEADSAIGVVGQTHVMLICPIAHRSEIEGAIEFEARGSRFLVESQKPDGIGGLQRFLTYGRTKDA